MDGIINIYKEKGYTSHDVVAKLRGIVKQKKIGHTGTLDPDAEGVLPVCLGNATKLCDLLTDKDKTYEAVLKLGITTDTQDMSGTVLSTAPVEFDKDKIEQVILSFEGEYDQIPPMYSALKVNGKKLYELAREGKVVERKPRKVTIQHIDILHMDEVNGEVTMKVSCSKGTYIRTLCYDIGEQLGCGGCMKSLLRTRVSSFRMEDSLKLSQIQELVQENRLDSVLIKADEMFPDYEKIMVAEEYCRFLYNGNKFRSTHLIGDNHQKENDFVRVYDSNDRFTGIYQYSKEEYKPVKMFL